VNLNQSEAIGKIRDLIIGTEFENNVFIAGGWCRDMLINRPSKDIDFVVTLPAGGIVFATWLTMKTGTYKKGSNPVYYGRFGTAAFRIWGHEFESVMSRQEAYEPGSRKPAVKFGNIEQDVFRRDFTINSLLYNVSTGEVVDLTNLGRIDIKEKILRTTSNPSDIFNEDPLRMLRCVRFACQLDFDIEEKTYLALELNSDALKTISKERINAELNKILISPLAPYGIELLVKTNLMKHIIPELYETIGMDQNKYHTTDVYNHILQVLSKTPAVLLTRMGALLHDIGKPKVVEPRTDGEGFKFINHENVGSSMTIDILKRLKYPTEFIDHVATIVKYHMRTKQYGDKCEKITDAPIRKLLRTIPGDILVSFLDVVHADNISHGDHSMPNQVPELISKINNISIRKEPEVIPVDGADIMETFNLKPGKKVGELLSRAEEIFLEDPNITKEELLKVLKGESSIISK